MSAALIRQHQARERFARALDRLHTELGIGTERRHLDVLVELCEAHLAALDQTTLRDSFAQRLDVARAMVKARHHLRLVPNTKEPDNDH